MFVIHSCLANKRGREYSSPSKKTVRVSCAEWNANKEVVLVHISTWLKTNFTFNFGTRRADKNVGASGTLRRAQVQRCTARVVLRGVGHVHAVYNSD